MNLIQPVIIFYGTGNETIARQAVAILKQKGVWAITEDAEWPNLHPKRIVPSTPWPAAREAARKAIATAWRQYTN